MKKTHLLHICLSCLSLHLSVFAQHISPASQEERVIHIQGSASREIIPNEYYFQVVAREFMQGKEKAEIGTLEKRLLQSLDSIGIDLNQISLDRMSDLQSFQKRKNVEHLTTQIYQIKLTNLEKLQAMLDVLGEVPVQSVSLDRVDHCDMVQFRKEVKIEAIKAGKEKADYLLEAVGNKTGKLLNVVEDEVHGQMSGFQTNPNLISNNSYVAFQGKTNSSSLTFKTIKIRFTFELKFEIAD